MHTNIDQFYNILENVHFKVQMLDSGPGCVRSIVLCRMGSLGSMVVYDCEDIAMVMNMPMDEDIKRRSVAISNSSIVLLKLRGMSWFASCCNLRFCLCDFVLKPIGQTSLAT
jgi:hypothetical protein